jgi:RecG-like helicase
VSDAPERRLRELGDVPVAKLRHIGEKRTAALETMGISNVFDLITVYPRRYVDRTRQVDHQSRQPSNSTGQSDGGSDRE